MTPAHFFRIMAGFAAGVAILMAALAVYLLAGGQVLPAVLLLGVAGVNVAGWRLFRTWSGRP